MNKSMFYLYGYVISYEETYCVNNYIQERNSPRTLDSCPELKYGVICVGR